MEQTKITVEQTVSATVRVNNMDDDYRAYDIVADVTVNQGNVDSVSGGQVREKGADTLVADFNAYPGNRQCIFYGDDETADCQILEAVSAFRASVKRLVSAQDTASLANA